MEDKKEKSENVYESMKFGILTVTDKAYPTFCNNIRQLVPLRVEFKAIDKTFVIEAYHPDFRQLGEGEMIPRYLPEFQRLYDDVGKETVVLKQMVELTRDKIDELNKARADKLEKFIAKENEKDEVEK